MAHFDRKLTLWKLLRQASDGVGLKVLAERLGVSKNTVQRDIDELSRAGVPVEESEAGQALRYRIREATPPSLQLGERDHLALQAAEAALKPYGSVGFADALSSLRMRLGDSVAADTEPPVFDAAQPSVLQTAPPSVLERLSASVSALRSCRITYQARWRSDARTYEIEPHSLFLSEGLTYLWARVPPHRRPTTFAVHLIRSVEPLERRFRRRHWKRMGFRVFEEPPRKVVVRFDREVACFIAERRWHPTQRLESTKDGSVILRARLGGKYEFLGWVLSWSPYAELLEPADWRRELLERAEGMRKKHRPGCRQASAPAESREPMRR